MRRMLIAVVFFASFAIFASFASEAPLAQAPDRSHPPASGPAPALSLPQIQKRQLSNGLPVWIVELHEVPVVQVNLVVPAGSAEDPSGKYGAANLTAAMLTEGAGSRSALEIADAVDFLGADLSATSAIDAAAVRLHVPVARLSDALPIMADVALRPTFPGEELERLRQQRLTSLLQARDDASTIASLALSRVLYGREHRYGTATMGTTETIRAMATSDLQSFYQARYSPTGSVLVVVGDVKPDIVLPLLEAQFGRWQARTPAPTKMNPVPGPRLRREIFLVDKPGAPQSQIRIGRIGVARSTTDYFPLQVMNTVFGGSFTSRLNMNLREVHGYSYGASSILDMRAQEGPFYAAAGVQTDKTAESLTEFFKEFTAINQPVPADELTRAKNYVALRFPGGFETTGDISRRLEEMLVYKLPDNYFSDYVGSIQRVTAADVQRVAQKYAAPNAVVAIVVGDKKVIEGPIRALNLGPITELPLDEVFNGR